MKNKLLTLLIFSFCIYVFGQNAKQDSITDQYLKNGAYLIRFVLDPNFSSSD